MARKKKPLKSNKEDRSRPGQDRSAEASKAQAQTCSVAEAGLNGSPARVCKSDASQSQSTKRPLARRNGEEQTSGPSELKRSTGVRVDMVRDLPTERTASKAGIAPFTVTQKALDAACDTFYAAFDTGAALGCDLVETATTSEPGDDPTADEGRKTPRRSKSPSSLHLEAAIITSEPTSVPDPITVSPSIQWVLPAKEALMLSSSGDEGSNDVASTNNSACKDDSAPPVRPASAVPGGIKIQRSTSGGGMYDFSDDEDESDPDEAFVKVSRHLNLAELGRLVQAADATLQHVAARNVVILLGKTGTGKSTLIHVLHGTALQRTTHKSAQDGMEKFVYKAQASALRGFDIGHDQTSQTKSIAHYTRVPVDRDGNGGVVYLDSAGFEDTTGLEVDIATSVSFKRVAEVCKSVRFAVLISCASFLESKGGAIRGLVKLISTLVGSRDKEDFSKHKLAFTFLFTHTELLNNTQPTGLFGRAVAAVSRRPSPEQEMEAARKRVHGLIVDTLEGTDRKDVEARTVLRWMDHCLKRKHPFVDVFHGQHSKAAHIIPLLEKFTPEPDGSLPAVGLAQSESPRTVVRCGVSVANESAIKLELGRNLEALGRALRGRRFEEMQELLHALDQVRRYLPLDSVRRAHERAAEAVDTESVKVREVLYALIDEGSDVSRDFDAAAVLRVQTHAAELRELRRLDVSEALRGSGEEEARAYAHARLSEVLGRLQRILGGPAHAAAFADALDILSRLHLWTPVIPGFAAAGNRVLGRHIGGCVARQEASGGVADAIAALQALLPVRRHLEELRRFDVPLPGVEDAIQRAVAGVESAIRNESAIATQRLRTVHGGHGEGDTSGEDVYAANHEAFQEELRGFTAACQHLEDLAARLDAGNLEPLAADAHTALQEVLHDLQAALICRQGAVAEAAQSGEFGFVLQEHVCRLRALYRAGTEQQQRECSDIYQQALEEVVRPLNAQAAQVDAVASQVVERGVGAARQCSKHIESLTALATCAWLDGLLVPERRFVRTCLEGARARYFSYFQDTGRSLLAALASYLHSPAAHSTELHAVRIGLAEVGRLAGLASVYACFGLAEERLREIIHRWTTEWCAVRRPGTQLPPELRGIGGIQAEAVNEVLAVGEAVGSMNLVSDGMREMLTGLDERLSKLRVAVELLFEAPGQYELKRLVLDAVQGWGGKGLDSMTDRMPKMPWMCGTLRDEVYARGTDLYEHISQSGEWERCEAELETLKEACVVDAYTSGQASHEVNRLTQFLKMTCSNVDGQLKQKIAAFDFRGMVEHLDPIIGAKDTHSKLRFDNLVTAIGSSVKAKIEAATAQVKCGSDVVEALRLLEAAQDEVGRLVRQHKSIDIGEAVRTIRARALEAFTDLLHGLQAALHASAYPAIQTQRLAVHNYHTAAGRLFPVEVNREAKKLLAEASDWSQKVHKLLDVFLDGLRHPSEDRVDSSKLLSALHKLKVVQRTDPVPEELQECCEFYNDATQKLHTRIYDILVETRSAANEDQMYSFAIDVYRYINKEWENGLKEHVAQLNIDIAKELESLEEKELEANAAYRAYLQDTTSMQQWVERLDRLKRKQSGLGSRLFDYVLWRGSPYQKAVCELQDEVSIIVQQARDSMLKHNYQLLGKTTAQLRSIQQVLGHHMQGYKQITKFESEVVGECRKLCADLAAALESENTSEFEMVFIRYHRFVQSVTLFNRGMVGLSERLHEKVCRCVEGKVEQTLHQLEAFEFDSASESVRTLRKLGQVLTGIYSVYCEGLEGSGGKEDRWLARMNEVCSKHFGGKALAHLGAHYATLEVQPNAPLAAIKKAYKKKCLQTHPDKGGSEEAQQRVQAAMEELEKPAVREQYQRGLREPFAREIRLVPRALRAAVQRHLDDGAYPRIKHVLVAMTQLPPLWELVPAQEAGAADRAREQIHDMVKAHVNAIHDSVMKHWRERKLGAMHADFATLARIGESLSAYPHIYSDQWSAGVSRSVEAEIQTLGRDARRYAQSGEAHADAHIRDLALQLVHLGRILDDLPRFKDMATIAINNVLEAIQDQQPWGFSYLFKLGIVLGQGTIGKLAEDGSVLPEDQRSGQVIVSSFKHFRDVRTVGWNEEVTQKDVSDTVKEIVGRHVAGGGAAPASLPVGHDKLLSGFREYERGYGTWFDMWCAGHLDCAEDIADKIITQARGLRPCRCDEWNDDLLCAIPGLLAGIFAYFTISKSGDSYRRLVESQGGAGGGPSPSRSSSTAIASASDARAIPSGGEHANTSNVLMKPHNIQILTILRILGYDRQDGTRTLANHLMQIRTGEGKSIILGACSTVLALLGFRVRCVCYSEYLSSRDWQLFVDLFDAFGVGRAIEYSTIQEYSEARLRAKGDLRSLTEQLVRGTNGEGAKSRGTLSTTTEEVLLVDEVDVFFGDDFYGKTLNPSTHLAAPEVQQIFRAIWALSEEGRDTAHTWQHVQNLEVYQTLLRRFSGWEYLLEGEVGKMCRDVKTFNTPAYHYERGRDKLGYKDMDGINYNTWYGYSTAFAYLHESIKGTFRDPDAALKEALTISVPCGHVSYANINPTRILGVSGTVDALSTYHWQVMRRYGIDTYSRMPSVYGKSNFRFLNQSEGAGGIVVEAQQDDYYRAITEEVQRAVQAGRAALVFFQDSAALKEYEASPYYKKMGNTNVLKEAQSHEEKEHVISKAATAGQATFTTAVFGRGTDFFCKDRKVIQAGGMHVVQTFFSVDKSEEVQVQGRTARQGKHGSYCMVLLEQHLVTRLGIQVGQAAQCSPAQLYSILDSARDTKQGKAFAEIERRLAKSTKKDEATNKYFDALLEGNDAAAKRLFKELYEGRFDH